MNTVAQGPLVKERMQVVSTATEIVASIKPEVDDLLYNTDVPEKEGQLGQVDADALAQPDVYKPEVAFLVAETLEKFRKNPQFRDALLKVYGVEFSHELTSPNGVTEKINPEVGLANEAIVLVMADLKEHRVEKKVKGKYERVLQMFLDRNGEAVGFEEILPIFGDIKSTTEKALSRIRVRLQGRGASIFLIKEPDGSRSYIVRGIQNEPTN